MASAYDQFHSEEEEDGQSMPVGSSTRDDAYSLPDADEPVMRTPLAGGYAYGANPPYDRMLGRMMELPELDEDDASATNAGLPRGHGQFRKEFMAHNPYISGNVIHLSHLQAALFKPSLRCLEVDEDDIDYEEQRIMEGQWDGKLIPISRAGLRREIPDDCPPWNEAMKSVRRHLEAETTMAYWTHDGADDSRCGSRGLHLHTLSRGSMVNDPEFLDMQTKLRAFVDGAPPGSQGRVSGLATSLFASCPFNLMRYMTRGTRELVGVKRLDWAVALRNCRGLIVVKGGGRGQDGMASHPGNAHRGTAGGRGRWQNNRRRRNIPYVARRNKY